MDITVALLAYKEEDNLRILLPKIKNNLKKIGDINYEIIVIDTAQPLDKTKELCKEMGAKYYNQEWPGFGGAFKTAIKYASKELFLILDSDGSHNPDYIPAIYKKFVNEQSDIVIGSRYVKGGKTCDSKMSIIMSKILNTAFRLCLGFKAKDISTDYRMYYTEQLKDIDLENKNYDVLQEVLLKLRINKPDLKIKEVPITFEKRVFGESKRQLIPFIISYIKSLFRLTCIRFPWIKNLFLYGIIGAFGAVIDFTIFTLLHIFFLKPEIANICGAVVGFLFTFSMNTFLNFKAKEHLIKKFLSYGAICIVGMGVSTVGIWIFKKYFNLYLLKGLLLIGVSILQFLLNKKITYREQNYEK